MTDALYTSDSSTHLPKSNGQSIMVRDPAGVVNDGKPGLNLIISLSCSHRRRVKADLVQISEQLFLVNSLDALTDVYFPEQHTSPISIINL